MRKCTRCNKDYPATSRHFLKDKRYSNSLTKWCRSCFNEYLREYNKARPKKSKERTKKFDDSDKRTYLKLKHSARSYLVTIDQEGFLKWYKSQPRKCCYCGLEETNLHSVFDSFNQKTQRLTIDRKDSRLGYEEGNMALCCLRCNYIKGNFFTPSEMEEIGRNYIAKRWVNAK